MRAPDDIDDQEREERRFRAASAEALGGSEGQGPAVQRFASMLLINALKTGASHLRVREGGAAEERHDRRWRDLGLEPPPRLWLAVIWALKEMAGIEPGVAVQCGARMRIALVRRDGPPSPCDFDVTYARTPGGAAIVLSVMPTSEVAVASLDAAAEARWAEADRQLALAAVADERGEHDAVRRGLRTAALAARAMEAEFAAHAAELLRHAAAIARSAGLEEDAIELLGQVLGIRATAGLVDPLLVVDAELALGAAHEELGRFAAAQPHFERALDAAESLGPENGLLVPALSAVGRGCARGGDPSRAERLLERAQAVAEVLVGVDSALLVPRLELARLRRARYAAEAAASIRQVLALAESFGDAWMTEMALAELAESELARGDVELASELLRRALALAGSHPRSIRLHAMLARALTGQDRRGEAAEVLRVAAGIARACRPAAHPERVAIEGELSLAERSSPYR